MPRGKPVFLSGDRYFVTFVWRGKTRRQYLLKKRCAACLKVCFQDASNARKGAVGYCRPACRYASQRGEGNVNFKGGRKFKRGKAGGPILLYVPGHPQAKKGYVYEHRVVVEKAVGRYLAEAELVHHVDFDPQSNDLGNLVVMTDAQHKRAHAQLGRCVKSLLAIGALRFNRKTLLYEVIP